ncbi:hypothetical protein BAE44_0003315 [Dichanthelium oligosanthes]|uniref:J domain-containing protein n=1 Tax=Dichanthelium oligosanthes TaxID=888268 RepID=A0A1E5WE50_9POAL|nr:hypothetical protein BAE44_0003315 [Dichanthelium oligosanthes]
MISAHLCVPSVPKAAAVGTPSLRPNPKASRIRWAATAASTVLGLRAGATVREIKADYRRLARERHPDVAGAAPGAAVDFVRLHDAYATLFDPDSRARYDRGVVVAVAVAVAQRPCYPCWGGATGRPRRSDTDTSGHGRSSRGPQLINSGVEGGGATSNRGRGAGTGVDLALSPLAGGGGEGRQQRSAQPTSSLSKLLGGSCILAAFEPKKLGVGLLAGYCRRSAWRWRRGARGEAVAAGRAEAANGAETEERQLVDHRNAIG